MSQHDHLIIYSSHYLGQTSATDHDLENICQEAKKNNPKLGITGVLFFHNGRFLQVLEGDKGALDAIMDVICRDKRHDQISRIVDEPLRKRSFSHWNMDSFNLDSGVSIGESELTSIAEVYRHNIAHADTEILVSFYKAMIESGQCRAR